MGNEDLLKRLDRVGVHQSVAAQYCKEGAATIRELLELEKQYAERLGRMAQLCATVCPWVLGHANLAEEAPEVKAAADEIMDYVEAVRP